MKSKKANQNAVALSAYYATMRGESNLSVSAICGKEGNRETYVAKLSFADVAKHFSLIGHENAPEGVMLQRELARSRSTAIKQYINQNQDFVFPSLIAVVEKVEVKAITSNVVELLLPANAFRYFVDGQGRLMGIKGALAENETLADNYIDVKVIVSQGTEKDAQVFYDVNRTPTSPNASQCIAMDSRMALSVVAKRIASDIKQLNGRIDFTKASVTNRKASSDIWTLNQLSKFILMLTGATQKTAETLFSDSAVLDKWADLIQTFFNKLEKHPDIKAIFENGLGEWSERSVVPTSVFLKSLAVFLKVAMMNAMTEERSMDWSFMEKLSTVDLSTDNEEWLGRCLNYRQRFEDKSFNHKAVASYLCKKCGLEMPDELLDVEESVLISRASMLKAQREDKQEQLAL